MSTVTATEFQRNIGSFIDEALVSPVTITKHARKSLVLISAERYEAMQAALTKSMLAHEVPDDLIKQVKTAKYGE